VICFTLIAALAPLQPQEWVQDAEVAQDAREAIDALSDEMAVELSEQFRMESSWRADFRAGLQTYLLKRPPRDPGSWPLIEPASTYDAKRHCPAQPIPRRMMRADDPRAARALERFKLVELDTDADPGWIYDYASRELRRAADWDAPKRVLMNGLLGYAPDQDLAVAILELHLDSGEQQDSSRAFAHAYSDRKGVVFPGVTLYDAWASGSQMEMPDVECLGIVHDLLDDWKTWRAPVRKQESLYDAIGELFMPLRQHRGLRHALAISYLAGTKVSVGEYASSHLELHALWEECSSTPPKLAERLPVAKKWRSFLEDWRDHVKESAPLHTKAQNRAGALVRSEMATHELVLRILRENELIRGD